MISVYNWHDVFKDLLIKESSKEEMKNNVLDLLNELYSQPVKVKKNIYDTVHERFNYEKESGWMLFSKNGIIVKAVETEKPCSRNSYGFRREEVLRNYEQSKNEGLELVGTAHFHTSKNWQYRGMFGSPKLASNNDMGIFHCHFPGLSFGDLDQEIFQKISNLERVILLGSQFENEEYNFRAFLALGCIEYYEKDGIILKLTSDENKQLRNNLSLLFNEHVIPFPESLRSEEPTGHQLSMVELKIELV